MAAQKFKQLEKALSRLPQIGKGWLSDKIAGSLGLGYPALPPGIFKYGLAQSGANDDDLARTILPGTRLDG